jgi:hypothetical protein
LPVGWYGNPRVSGNWRHWKPEPDQVHAQNITDTPLDKLYDSHDPAELAHQAAEARQAGLPRRDNRNQASTL